MQTTYARTSNEATQLEEDGRRVARLAARESIVLLENDGALPLKPGRIALFGAGAGMTVSGGTGSGEVNVRHVTSVREGLEAAGFEIATAVRIDAYERTWHEEREAFIAEQRAKMKRPSLRVLNELIAMEYRPPEDEPVTGEEAHSLDADTCLYVLSRQSGEGIDRTDESGSYRLTDHEIADIRTCAESFDTTIVVLNVGAPIDLSFRKEIPGINALVLMGQLGMEGGHALADIISGSESPSGKLAVSWPESLAQVPYSSEFGLLADDLDSADYKEGVYVGYRYYTSFDVKPAYPFGFGLSYATFSQRLESMTLEGTTVKLAVAVENTSPAFAGKHVVQVYASCPEGALCKERVRLVAFAKTPELAPGESRLVALSFPLRELASYDESQVETVLEAGDYIVSLGTSAFDTTPVATVTAPVRIVLEKHRNLCASSGH
ncbi:MAG: glycoside hydrolase family 3 C-terminal domain-containing protein, partial [Eggerthellaceae bacterium]|nr:glycoside hydrolase family 3 C-terminal domain-containing protein [Eggerthellaceae bacterium]